jgi:predicted transcriptional regulator
MLIVAKDTVPVVQVDDIESLLCLYSATFVLRPDEISGIIRRLDIAQYPSTLVVLKLDLRYEVRL